MDKREIIECKIPIMLPNIKNENNVIVPDDVLNCAINNASNQPIIFDDKVIGVLEEGGNAKLWLRVQPELTINKFHMDGTTMVLDDISIYAINLAL